MTTQTSEWNRERQQRLDELHGHEEAGTLTPAEQTELLQLYSLLDEQEWQQLQPALESMEREHAAAAVAISRLEGTREDLARLIARKRRLVGIATGDEEISPEELALLEEGEADIKAGRLIPHAEVVKSVRKTKRRNGSDLPFSE